MHGENIRFNNVLQGSDKCAIRGELLVPPAEERREHCKQIMKHLFTLWCEPCHILVKLIPHRAIFTCRSLQTADTTRLLHRIERRKIAKLHGQTAGCSSHLLRHFNNDWVALVKFAERQFAIQIERNQEMLARPPNTGCSGHGSHNAKPCGFIEAEMRLPKTEYLARWYCPYGQSIPNHHRSH